jgi:hypothetical protein
MRFLEESIETCLGLEDVVDGYGKDSLENNIM